MRPMTSTVKDHPSFKPKQWTLTADDRCDKCSAQALVKVKGLKGELTFCNHHYEKIVNNTISYEKLFHFGIEFIDEREKLEQNKPIGAI
jgi:hypothetical protein